MAAQSSTSDASRESTQLQKLSGDTVRLISSAQVITSVASVIKELVENSLDAHADSIEVKLENFGVDKVEIRDNGDGISSSDANFVGQRHFTSKITDHADLESLTTYGFRGEALSSLCAISTVTIATKTKEDEVGRLHVLDQQGKVLSTKPSQLATGTTITATKLFHNVPVRKQYYGNNKRRREELKKIEDLLMSFGVICPCVRFALSHNKSPIWQKNKAPDMKSALLSTLGSNVMGQLKNVESKDNETQVHIEGYLPKPNSDHQLTTRAADDRSWISVNGRPVNMKDIGKVVKQYYCQAHPKAGNVRHVVMCLAVIMPTNLVDINLEPNKTRVLLQNKDAVLSMMVKMLEDLYAPVALPPPHKPAPGIQSSHQSTDSLQSDIPVGNKSIDTPPVNNGLDHEAIKNGSSHSAEGLCNGNRTPTQNGDITEVLRCDDGTGQSSALRSSDEAQQPGDLTRAGGENEQSGQIQLSQPNFSLLNDTAELFPVTMAPSRTEEDLTAVSRSDKQGAANDGMTQNTVLTLHVEKPSQPNFSLLDNKADLFPATAAPVRKEGDATEVSRSDEQEVANNGMTQEKCEPPLALAQEIPDTLRNTEEKQVEQIRPSQPNFSLFDDSLLSASVVEAVLQDAGGCQSDTGDVKRPHVSGDTVTLGTVGPPVEHGGRFQGLGGINFLPAEIALSTESSLASEDLDCEKKALDWSRGCALSDEKGRKVNPTALLVLGKENQTCSAAGTSLQSDISGDPKPNSATSSRNAALFESTNEKVTSSAESPSGRLQPTDPPSPRLPTINGQIPSNHLTDTCDLGSSDISKSANERVTNGSSPNQSPGKQKRPIEAKNGTGPQYDLVGKTPIRKPQTAFVFFSKESRADVLRQHPTSDFLAINKILETRWNGFSDEEREKYEEMQAKDLQRYKDQVKAAKQSMAVKPPDVSLPPRKKKKSNKLSNQSLINEMLASQRERKQIAESLVGQTKDDVVPKVEVRLPFSVDNLKPVISRKLSCDDQGLRLVGSLSGHGVWLAVRGHQVALFNQYRAQEVVLYHRLLSNHRLPRQTLPVPIVLSSGMFGDHWCTLLSLRNQVTSPDQSRLYVDDRLILNGFEIRQLIDPETSDVRLEVIAMATDIIPFYGLDDLKEILESIATQGAKTAQECRPLKLGNYLMAEAVRMARSLPQIMTEDEVYEIVDGIEQLTSWKSRLCLHGKEFEKEIYTIPKFTPD